MDIADSFVSGKEGKERDRETTEDAQVTRITSQLTLNCQHPSLSSSLPVPLSLFLELLHAMYMYVHVKAYVHVHV